LANILTALQQERLINRPCGCGAAVLTDTGLVQRVESCPECLGNALDFLREVCYDANRLSGVGRERQLDLFFEDPSAEGPSHFIAGR